MEKITLTKPVFEKRQYQKVIPTAFNELIINRQQLTVAQTVPSITEFFNNYTQLFFNIPQFGPTNSHEYLIQQSSQYIGLQEQQQSDDVQALLIEIDSLRTINLELNQQIITIQSASNATTV